MSNNLERLVELTLGEICELAEVQLPEKFANLREQIVPNISSEIKNKDSGYCFFVPSYITPGLGREKAIEACSRDTKIIFSEEQYFDNKGVELPCIIMENPREGFSKVCNYIRKKSNAKIIALTGSIGKTTVKEMLASVLAVKFNTLQSYKNANAFSQVGWHIEKLTEKHEAYIQEIGAGSPGFIEKSAKMLCPDYFVVTNIGLNHIEQYETQENIIEDKLSFDKYLSEDGIGFLNCDDKILKEINLIHKKITYGVENEDADFFGTNLKEEDGHITFDIRYGEKIAHLRINVIGKHNVSNAVVCFAIGTKMGMSVEEIAEGLANYSTRGIRQNLVGKSGCKLYIDCYNASQVSVKAALSTLDSMRVDENNKKIAVLADIEKLGELAEKVHREVGQDFSNHNADVYICFGENYRFAAEEGKKAGIKVLYTTDRKQLEKWIKLYSRPGNILLFKGGQKSLLSMSIDSVFGTTYVTADGDMLKVHGVRTVWKKYDVRLIEKYGCLIMKGDIDKKKLRIPGRIKGYKTVALAKNSFCNRDYESAVIGKHVKNIGFGAFYKCDKLRSVTLPKKLIQIEQSAFNNCKALEKVDIPVGTKHIGPKAFYKCKALKEIIIPNTVSYIGEGAFDLCNKLTIICDKDSYAYKYAKENNLSDKIKK